MQGDFFAQYGLWAFQRSQVRILAIKKIMLGESSLNEPFRRNSNLIEAPIWTLNIERKIKKDKS